MSTHETLLPFHSPDTPQIGDVYWFWRVVDVLPSNRRSMRVLCECVCGTRRLMLFAKLKRGEPKACGCRRGVRHGHHRNRKPTPTYSSWEAMHARCRLSGRPNSDRYHDRGIKVCERWKVFENFLADMGERPPETTLDRVDSNGNYTPENCRWATKWEQARNRRRNRLTLATATQVAVARLRGETCPSIAKRFGISESLPREIAKGRTWPDALAAAKEIVRNET